MSREVPNHGAEFIIRMKAKPVVNGVEFVSLVLEKNMAALAVGVVDQQVEERDWFEQFAFFGREVEIMILNVVADELLERAAPEVTVLAQGGDGDQPETELLAETVTGTSPKPSCSLRR